MASPLDDLLLELTACRTHFERERKELKRVYHKYYMRNQRLRDEKQALLRYIKELETALKIKL